MNRFPGKQYFVWARPVRLDYLTPERGRPAAPGCYVPRSERSEYVFPHGREKLPPERERAKDVGKQGPVHERRA